MSMHLIHTRFIKFKKEAAVETAGPTIDYDPFGYSKVNKIF
jgi:hypothetical protein